MSIYGWISIAFLLLLMIIATVQMFKKVPENEVSKRILALTPIILAVLFVLFAPKDLLYEDEAVSSLSRTLIPFVGIAFSLPLILKANKEKKN